MSLNEVGGEPDKFGVAPDALHALAGGAGAEMAARPLRLLDARHQAQRGRPRAHQRAVGAAGRVAAGDADGGRGRTGRRASIIDGESYPSRNEEYLLYQTLVGTWPLAPMTADEERDYRERIRDYMLKTMREAKVFTSWLNPSEPHEQAMARFVEMVLSPDNTAFRGDFVEFARRVARLRHLQLARAARDQDRRAGRPGFLPGHRAVGFQPGRSG